MGYVLKGPGTITLGYQGQNSTPDLLNPGEAITDPRVTFEDLKNLAKSNKLTDDQGGEYDCIEDEATGARDLVKVVKDADGNPSYQVIDEQGHVAQQVAETAATVDQPAPETTDNDAPNVVGA